MRLNGTSRCYDGGLILYGLRSLVFDQTWSAETRQVLVARHTVYDGRLIATELIPTVIDDEHRPHEAEGELRAGIWRQCTRPAGGEKKSPLAWCKHQARGLGSQESV